MNLPSLQGNLAQSGFFVYAAADPVYFDRYGRALIQSVLRNTDYGVHMHIYNATPEQIAFCQQPRVSVSWEHVVPGQFDAAMKLWNRHDLPEPYASRKNKMLGIKIVDNSLSPQENLRIWLLKTYYACMRFVRLAELIQQPRRFLEIDVDGLVRSNFPTQFADDADHDIYLYEKIKRDRVTGQEVRSGHLAGSILWTDKPEALQFLQDLAQVMRHEIEQDNIYWFLDQNVLDATVAKYRKGTLPVSYVDWHMQPDSAIWTAKGKRKELEKFTSELAKYS